MKLRHWPLTIASYILISSLVGCSTDENKNTTEKTTISKSHVPTAKVEKL